MYLLYEAVAAIGLFKGNILISVMMDTMVLYAMACRLWVSETAGLSDGITGTYVTQHMTMCQYGEDRGDLLLADPTVCSNN